MYIYTYNHTYIYIYIYTNETILFRLQLFQCNVKIHLIRSIPEYKTNTKNSSLNIHIPAC